ncbi:MAG TPA: hypothetical protein VGP91_20470, partial [Actinoplanes sp.]|nr:hypothetical protein [Actinoplanes sp.]
MPLTMQPARTAQIAGVHPVLVIGICTGLGALVGVFAAMAALLQPVSRWSLTTVSIAIWTIAVVSVAPSLGPNDPLPAVRLGVFDAGYLSPATTQRTALFTMPALALLTGALVGWTARRRGCSTLTIALAGLPGPALLTLAYLIAGPGSGTERYQVVPYWAAMTATGAGVLGSVLAAVVRRGEGGDDGDDTDDGGDDGVGDDPKADRPRFERRPGQPDSEVTTATAPLDRTSGPTGANLGGGLGGGAASGAGTSSGGAGLGSVSGSRSGSGSGSGKRARKSVFDALKGRLGKGSSTAAGRGLPRRGGALDSADMPGPNDFGATGGPPSSGAASAPFGSTSGGPPSSGAASAPFGSTSGGPPSSGATSAPFGSTSGGPPSSGLTSAPFGSASGGPTAAADRRPDPLGGRPASLQDSMADSRPGAGGSLDTRSAGPTTAPQSHSGGAALGDYAAHEPPPFDGFARGENGPRSAAPSSGSGRTTESPGYSAAPDAR